MPMNIKMGEKSKPPIGGITFLTGDITGSVNCQINLRKGCGFILPENIMTKDMMMEAMMA